MKEKSKYILGVETSCDETAAAILKISNEEVVELASVISSQIDIHKKYGGVVPEVAAREHVLNILPVINEVFEKSKTKASKLDLIAVSNGPGLITSLLSGVETVKSLAYVWKKPLVGINHVEGHIYANFLTNYKEIRFPSVILTVSGGHTILLLMNKNRKVKIIGETRDDAAGEAFDKIAKMLGLSYPGGPIISKLAENYDNRNHKLRLPRPMIDSPDFDFSFSGLKTAVLYEIKKDKNWKKRVNEYCYESQEAISDILVKKTLKAAKTFKAKTIMLTGGVSANKRLREKFQEEVSLNFSKSTNFLAPKLQHTTDNASMIAAAAFFKLKDFKNYNNFKVKINPSSKIK